MTNKTFLSKRTITLMILILSMLLIVLIMDLSLKQIKKVDYQDEPEISQLIQDEQLDIFNRNIMIPKTDNMVPQGLTVAKDAILISAYNFKGIDNSIIYVLDIDGNIRNICTLDIKSHIGGIYFDKNTGLLWVTGHNGHINTYFIEDILNSEYATATYDFDVGENLPDFKDPSMKEASFLTIHEDILYVGNFSLKRNGITKKYKINKSNSSISLEYLGFFKIPDKVQGIAFYQYKKEKYIIMSTSFGRKSKSLIKIFKYDENITDYTNSKIPRISQELPPMAEQIITKDNALLVLFESNSNIYDNCPEKSETLSLLNINDILTNFPL